MCFLDSSVRIAGNASATLVFRVAVDQLMFSPTSLAAFLAYVGAMSPKSDSRENSKIANWRQSFTLLPWNKRGGLEGARQRVKEAWKPSIITSLCIWPWVQFLNFSVIPLNYRVIVINGVALAWNTYLAYMASTRKTKPETNQSYHQISKSIPDFPCGKDNGV
jgi:Mpv17 / PMP22 family